ncbi:MAG: flavodoxin family protein, partial [Desulfobulbaceae bacterium]|nr:flavodoxin family protein [Desulfobulbaceae bacterium]
INGSYRQNGVTDQVVGTMTEALKASGAEVEIVLLRNYPVEFCTNCRKCAQQPGDGPAECVLEDAMQDLIDKIEKSDGYILASPTNFGSVTALFKRFMERLVVYAYWPWDMNSPQYRKAKVPKKKTVLVSSSAAPGLMGRLFFSTLKELKTTAKMIGAAPVGTIFTGLIATAPHPVISEKVQAKARVLAAKLV